MTIVNHRAYEAYEQARREFKAANDAHAEAGWKDPLLGARVHKTLNVMLKAQSQWRGAQGGGSFSDRIRGGVERFYDVGVFADGALHNPHGFPEAEVRVAIAAALERNDRERLERAEAHAERVRQNRSEGAKQAAI